MALPTKKELEIILEEAQIDNILIFTSEGYLIESNSFDYDGNYAAMCGMITKMCQETIKDLQYGNIDKITIHADKGLIMVNRFDEKNYMACFTKDSSKQGVLMRIMNMIISTATDS